MCYSEIEWSTRLPHNLSRTDITIVVGDMHIGPYRFASLGMGIEGVCDSFSSTHNDNTLALTHAHRVFSRPRVLRSSSGKNLGGCSTFSPFVYPSTLGCKTQYGSASLGYCSNLRPLMTDDDFDHWEKIDVGRAAAGDGG